MTAQPPSAALPTPSLRGRAAWFALIAGVALAAYWRSFAVPFQFDDFNHIVDNRAIRGDDLGEFFRFGRTRLIPFASLALNYWFGKLEPFAYHVFNFLVHLLATLAVYGLALTLCRSPRLRHTAVAAHPVAFAAGAAFIFACHPIQVQAVTYIVQRITSMAALFYVGAVFCYARARNAELRIDAGRPRPWYVATAMCTVAALLSKENAASLPVALLLTESVFYSEGFSRQSLRRIGLVTALLVLLPVGWWLLPQPTARLQNPAAPAAEVDPDAPAVEADAEAAPAPGPLWSIRALIARAQGPERVSPLQYLMTQCLVLPRYLRMVAVPYGFNVDHDVPIARTPSLGVVAGAALLLSLLAVGLFTRTRWPLLSFGILWTFTTLSVESSVLPIRDPMVEHRMYLAMPGIAFIVSGALIQLAARVPVLAYVAAVAVVCVLPVTTFLRNQVWLTPLALWGDAVEKAPNKARPHVNLATALHHGGRDDQAIAHYCWALRLDPTSTRARENVQALADLQAEKQMAAGEMVVMGGTINADGELELAPRDPCAGR